MRKGKPEKLHLQRLRLVDYAYDTGGAYWGMGEPLYCAFSTNKTKNDPPIRVFVRAKTREEAKEKVSLYLEVFNNKEKGWRFFR